MLVGFAPVLTAGKVDLTSALNAGGRSGTETKRERSFRNALVVAEITITLVLAFSSGLLLRSLISRAKLESRIRPRATCLRSSLVLPGIELSESRRPFRISTTGCCRIFATLPGAHCSRRRELSSSRGRLRRLVVFGSRRSRTSQRTTCRCRYSTSQIPDTSKPWASLCAKAACSQPPIAQAPAVAIVNEILARQWFPKESAVGHQIKYGGPYMPGPTIRNCRSGRQRQPGRPGRGAVCPKCTSRLRSGPARPWSP